jgi:hypothetical protein
MLIPLQAGSTIINLVILLEVSDLVKAREWVVSQICATCLPKAA